MLVRIFNNIESIICRTLLSGFVLLLFVQIVSREVFGYSFSWIEELSVYMFVWFVFFGASYAALKGAHNRVTFQFRFLPHRHVKWVEAFADLFWVAFNITFIWLSYDFVFNKMNKFWKSQTLGIEMKWIYVVLPVAFTLMTVRILQVNYIKLVRGEQIADPDQIDLDAIKSETSGHSALQEV
ncbi:TRAP transporter small permease [Primorskyibacter sedentarius]|uniref:TRAP transporter small permease protein n=1 Tax=Primorskyibacter sedentarius TaxID=745311 RepID=A0A4R3JKP7_9RHOB|nr:TRAP transporter small permease [Primorskyibacter sedentarius]TCS66918.1 TRAP-type C4-dicarboxylate transport system permease small subunit [Primorskyibacter sedentarius]